MMMPVTMPMGATTNERESRSMPLWIGVFSCTAW